MLVHILLLYNTRTRCLFLFAREIYLFLLFCFVFAGWVDLIFQDGIHILNIGKTWEKLVLAARIIVAIENPQVREAQTRLLEYPFCSGGHPEPIPGCFGCRRFCLFSRWCIVLAIETPHLRTHIICMYHVCM